MQNEKGYKEITNNIINTLDEHFGEKIDDFVISGQTDIPYTMFHITFDLYNYFNIILNFDRGRFGCSILNGERGISIETSQKWYDKADLTTFCEELAEDLESRIPDKFLQRKGWLE